MSDKSKLEVKSTAEVDWFDFETRMRRIIQELLDPTIRRSLEDKEIVNSLKKSLDLQKRKIEEIEFVIHKTQKRTTIFEEINKKMVEMESDRKLGEARAMNEVASLKDEIDQIKFDLQRKTDEIDQISNINNDLRNQMLTFNNQLIEHKTKTNNLITDQQKENLQQFSDIRLIINNVEDKAMEGNRKGDSNLGAINKLDNLLEECRNKVKDN